MIDPFQPVLHQSQTRKLLTAVSELSCQMTLFATDLIEQLTTVYTKLVSMEEGMAALGAKINREACVEEMKTTDECTIPNFGKNVFDCK